MTIYFSQTQVKTDKSLEEVKEATLRAMRRVGGGQTSTHNTIHITNGVNGVTAGFMGTFNSRIEIDKNKGDKYTITAEITKSTNALFWICLVGGFCLFFTWILNILYLVADPTAPYQSVLNQIENELDR